MMAADLARSAQSGITVQLCGDAHLSNFGGFAGPARRLLFDLNDFDVTLPGPWEWDVKRLAASLAVAARQRRFGGADRGVRIGRPQIVDERVRELFRAYRGTLAASCAACSRATGTWTSRTRSSESGALGPGRG